MGLTNLLPGIVGVVVPKGAKIYRVHQLKTNWLLLHNSDFEAIPLPPGNYELIGLGSDLTEEQAGEIVEYDERTETMDFNAGGGGLIKYKAYRDYIDLENAYEFGLDSIESFASLLRSLNLDAETTVILRTAPPETKL